MAVVLTKAANTPVLNGHHAIATDETYLNYAHCIRVHVTRGRFGPAIVDLGCRPSSRTGWLMIKCGVVEDSYLYVPPPFIASTVCPSNIFERPKSQSIPVIDSSNMTLPCQDCGQIRASSVKRCSVNYQLKIAVYNVLPMQVS